MHSWGESEGKRGGARRNFERTEIRIENVKVKAHWPYKTAGPETTIPLIAMPVKALNTIRRKMLLWGVHSKCNKGKWSKNMVGKYRKREWGSHSRKTRNIGTRHSGLSRGGENPTND